MTAFLEFHIKTADNIGLFVRDYAPERSAGRLPVLCLHGLTRNSADFEVVAPQIAALGRRTVALDMRGRGRSGWDPTPDHYRPDVYVRDVLQVLDALNIPRAIFLGTSLGGIVTMATAAAAPDRIGAAILNDVGPVLDPAGLARIAGYVGKTMLFSSWDEAIAAVKTAQTVAFPDANEKFWEVFARRVACERPDGKIAFAYDPAIAAAFLRPQPSPPPSMVPLFEALSTVPILLVRGALSDLLPLSGVVEMKKIKPDLHFVEVQRVGHAPTLEEPAAWQAIASFLAKAD